LRKLMCFVINTPFNPQVHNPMTPVITAHAEAHNALKTVYETKTLDALDGYQLLMHKHVLLTCDDSSPKHPQLPGL
jgi:hypothetical protein